MRKTPRELLLVGALIVIPFAALPGCATPATPVAELRPTRPAYISHIVLVSLLDPADADELLEDSERMLASIPGVVSFAAGPHLDNGRDTIIDDYDIGLYIGFDSEARYAEYVEHPSHIAYLEKWRPRVASLRIYDIGDPTP
jgi:hypothetical protein